MSGLRKRKVPQAFQQPFNNLSDGGPIKKNKNIIYSPARRSTRDQTVIKSDKNLLLSDHDSQRKNTINSVISNDDIWDLPQHNDIPIHKLKASKASRVYQEDNNAFSDSDSNDLPKYVDETVALYDLKLDELQQKKQITKILIPLISLIGIREEDQFKSGIITYKMKLSRTLEKLEVFGEPSGDNDDEAAILYINPKRDIEEISASDESILIQTSHRFKLSDKSQSRFLVRLSSRNLEKFNSLWALLITEQETPQLSILNKPESELRMELKTARMSGLASSALRSSTAKFLNKSLTSLQPPRRQGRNKGAPATVNATPIRSNDFYTPAKTTPSSLTLVPNSTSSSSRLPSPLTSGRKLRSKPTAEHITIDDVDLTTPKKSFKDEKFGPSLTHIFSDKTQFEIKESDYHCLQGSQWVNDVIIDFFMKYYMEKSIDESKLIPSDAHVLTTFFMYKLKSSKNHYENISRWVSKLDLLNKKFVVLPVNESLHWFGLIINNLNSILDEPEGKGIITIYVFDSLKQTHENLLAPLRNFIIGYAKDKYGKTVIPKQIKLVTAKVAKQPNFNDCGVHVIFNVMRFFEDRSACLKLWNQDVVSPREQSECFPKKRRDKMRDELRGILKNLQEEQQSQKDESGLPKSAEENNTNNKEHHDDESEDEIFCIDAEEFQRGNDSSKDKSESETNESKEVTPRESISENYEVKRKVLNSYEDSNPVKVDKLSNDVNKMDIDQNEETIQSLPLGDKKGNEFLKDEKKLYSQPDLDEPSKHQNLEDMFSEEEAPVLDFASRLRAAKGAIPMKKDLILRDVPDTVENPIRYFQDIKPELQVQASQESISSEFENLKGSQRTQELANVGNEVQIYTQSVETDHDIRQIQIPKLNKSAGQLSLAALIDDQSEQSIIDADAKVEKLNEQINEAKDSLEPSFLKLQEKKSRDRLQEHHRIKEIGEERRVGNGLVNGKSFKKKGIGQKLIPSVSTLGKGSSSQISLETADNELEELDTQNSSILAETEINTNDQEPIDDLSDEEQMKKVESQTEVIDEDFQITNISSSLAEINNPSSSRVLSINPPKRERLILRFPAFSGEKSGSTRDVLKKLSRAKSSIEVEGKMNDEAESDIEEVTDSFILKPSTSFEL